jgi:hypothetical protein
MEINSLNQFWPLINAAIREILAITEPHIEEAALRKNVPIELYYYGELGLDTFSIEEFQQRDPFSNPEQFERLFPRLEIKGWIVPAREDGRFEVTEGAREAVREIVQTGDAHLAEFELEARVDLERLLHLLKKLIIANNAAPEPPHKWAIKKRFHVTNRNSPAIVKIRECLMDVLAYRDDAHLSAARPHFNQAGIVWIAFGSVWSGEAVTAEKIAEIMSFRGYEIRDYSAALQAAVEVGWVEETDGAGTYRATTMGKELREQVEKLTDEYFYHPWAAFSPGELQELFQLLTQFCGQLHEFTHNSETRRLAA